MLDAVAEASQFADHLARPHFLRLGADGRTAFFVPDSLVKNLPDQTTEPVGDGANGLGMAESRDESAIDDREDRAFGLHRGVRRLIQDASHLTVAFGAAVTVVHACAFLVAGAGAHPGGEMFGRGKRRCSGADFRDDLLRGIDAEPWHLREPLHRVVMCGEQARHFLVELADLFLDQVQFVQRHLQKPPVDGMQRRADAERVAQLFRRGA